MHLATKRELTGLKIFMVSNLHNHNVKSYYISLSSIKSVIAMFPVNSYSTSWEPFLYTTSD